MGDLGGIKGYLVIEAPCFSFCCPVLEKFLPSLVVARRGRRQLKPGFFEQLVI